MAVVPEPGMPKVKSGTQEPVQAALLAASGAANPRALPRPIAVSDRFGKVFSNPYARKDAIVAPAPGNVPTKNPRIDPLPTAGAMVLVVARPSANERNPNEGPRSIRVLALAAI